MSIKEERKSMSEETKYRIKRSDGAYYTGWPEGEEPQFGKEADAYVFPSQMHARLEIARHDAFKDAAMEELT